MKPDTGKEGEKLAEQFLRKNGYKILRSNYRNALGEVDLIALDGKTIVFVEVKTNTSDEFGAPEDRVDQRKQKQIAKSALGFLKEIPARNLDYRFDVIGIQLYKDARPKIEHYKNAFEVDGFLF